MRRCLIGRKREVSQQRVPLSTWTDERPRNRIKYRVEAMRAKVQRENKRIRSSRANVFPYQFLALFSNRTIRMIERRCRLSSADSSLCFFLIPLKFICTRTALMAQEIRRWVSPGERRRNKTSANTKNFFNSKPAHDCREIQGSLFANHIFADVFDLCCLCREKKVRKVVSFESFWRVDREWGVLMGWGYVGFERGLRLGSCDFML